MSGGACRSIVHQRPQPICTARSPLAIIMGLLGGIAQLGERLHGMQEVSGSIPLTSTRISARSSIMRCRTSSGPQQFDSTQSRSSRGLGHHPFTVSTGVRIPYGTPSTCARPGSLRDSGHSRLLQAACQTNAHGPPGGYFQAVPNRAICLSASCRIVRTCASTDWIWNGFLRKPW